jgi:hypothetical protein
MSWKKWRGKQVEKEFNKAASEAVENAIRATGEVSDQQVPHDTGELSQSKFISVDPNNELKVWIGYGGGGNTGIPEVPYAAWWHENPANFQKGRKSQYLRDPVKTHLPKYLITELKKLGLK